ncbi:MAG: hypothetical protein HY336_02375 [Candidatus Doudnabacteria bacterium]|nr:hypothetical protein [Candidatus Doudnabacteria bacterium]
MRERNSYIPDELNRQFIPRPEEQSPEIDKSKLEGELEAVRKQPLLDSRAFDKKIFLLERIAVREKETPPSEFFAQVLKEILAKINAELHDLGDFKIRDQAEVLLSKPDDKIIALVKKYLPEIWERAMEKNDNVPIYSRLDKKIRADSLDSQALTMIQDLGSRGFSEYMSSLHHETIHSFQDEATKEGSAGDRLIEFLAKKSVVGAGFKFILNMAGRNKLSREQLRLLESQAYLGKRRYGQFKSIETVENLVDVLSKGYRISKKSKGRKKTVAAIADIKKIYALGLSEEVISQLTAADTWDKKKGVYENLHGAVNALRKSSGYMESDLDKLVEIDDLRRDIYIERVMRIVQTVVQRRIDQSGIEREKGREKTEEEKILDSLMKKLILPGWGKDTED